MYASIQAHRELHGSFATFCDSLVKDLALKVAGCESKDSEGDDGDNSVDANEGSALNANGISVVYNKRDTYFTN